MTHASSQTSKKKSGPFAVVVARGEDMRHFFVHPWLLVTAALAVTTITTGSMGVAGYLLLQEKEIAVEAPAPDTHERRKYEERIAELRALIDRLTSQRVLERERLQRKVDELVERQEQLAERYAEFAPTLNEAETAHEPQVPHPSPRPDLDITVTGNAYSEPDSVSIPWPLRDEREISREGANKDTEDVSSISDSLRAVERNQLKTLHALTRQTYQAAGAINEALDQTGASLEHGDHLGGPFIPPGGRTEFEEKVHELDIALAMLEDLTRTARALPLAVPVQNAAVTSRFGVRRDPILGRKAHHSGVDFRAQTGTPVRASGAGRVVKAGWSGGYGRMVEIDHGNGIVTRYAHLSALQVDKGVDIETGAVVGFTGSSGRSTGPHLHYEVRRRGKATDPMQFIEAGRRIAQYL